MRSRWTGTIARSVALALFCAVAEPLLAPSAAVAEVTPDLTSHQGYLDSSQNGGIDARFAWTMPGGTGENVRVADIEYAGWNLEHEDLPDDVVYVPNGDGIPFDFADDHGSGVIGVMVADDNGFGLTGVVPDAGLRVIPHLTNTLGYLGGIEHAIRVGIDTLESGDVMLIEANTGGSFGQNAPVEWVAAIYGAIVDATAAGIIVVQTAGNGGQDLDASTPTFAGYGDSGSIIVGAGMPPGSTDGSARSALSFSNHGDRVDLQGWGSSVATIGGAGDLYGGGQVPCRSPIFAQRFTPVPPYCSDIAYRSNFGGTSSAGPIVAGAAAALSSIAQEHGRLLTPHEVRDILVATGTPQVVAPGETEITHPIGPLPDLEAATVELFDRYDSDGDGVLDPSVDTVADSYITAEDTALVVDATTGVLANDSDEDGETLSAALSEPAEHGTVSLAADGSFTYTPEPDYFGSDAFTYTATDGKFTTEPTTVAIAVTPVPERTVLDVDPVVLKIKPGLIRLTIGVVSATLTIDGGVPVAGQTILFRVNGSPVCVGVTASSGRAVCSLDLLETVAAILAGGVSAEFAGSDDLTPARGQGGLLGG